MRTIKLKVDDKSYDDILKSLKILKVKGIIKIVEDENYTNSSMKASLKKLLATKKSEVFSKIDNPLEWQRKSKGTM